MQRQRLRMLLDMPGPESETNGSNRKAAILTQHMGRNPGCVNSSIIKEAVLSGALTASKLKKAEQLEPIAEESSQYKVGCVISQMLTVPSVYTAHLLTR